MFGLEYPSIELLVEWPTFLGGEGIFGFNKIALINLLAVLLTGIIFRGRQQAGARAQGHAQPG